jgi:hypothetical protein
MRRYKLLLLSYGDILRLMDGTERITNTPEGARFVKHAYDHTTDSWAFIVEHESFPEVPSGELLERIDAVVEHVPSAVAIEREECARIAHTLIGREQDDLDVAEEIEHRIRARGMA